MPENQPIDIRYLARQLKNSNATTNSTSAKNFINAKLSKLEEEIYTAKQEAEKAMEALQVSNNTIAMLNETIIQIEEKAKEDKAKLQFIIDEDFELIDTAINSTVSVCNMYKSLLAQFNYTEEEDNICNVLLSNRDIQLVGDSEDDAIIEL